MLVVKEGWLPPVLVATIFFIAVIRSQGVYPSIFADEWHYSLLSRLVPFSSSDDPGYLYLSIFRLTRFFWGGGLEVARIFNSIFYALAWGYIYKTAKDVLPVQWALGVLALGVVAPEGVYAIFFMPEALYFFAFSFFSYWLLRSFSSERVDLWHVVWLGAVFGGVTLVKPHALFLLPAIGGFILFSRVGGNGLGFYSRLRMVFVFFLFSLFLKLLFGYFVAGVNGLTLFGSRYSGMAQNNISYARLFDLFLLSLRVFVNNVAMLAVVYGIPALACLGFLLSKKDEICSRVYNISIYILFVLFALLIVTSSFSASVAGTNPYDVVGRLHTRYYNFAFPLLVVVAACAASGIASLRSMRWQRIISLAVLVSCVVGVWMVVFRRGGLQVNWIDSPLLLSYEMGGWLRVLYGGGSIVLIALSVFLFKSAARIYFVVFLPFVFLANTHAVQKTVESRKFPDVYDSAGVVLSGLLKGKSGGQVTLFGPDEALLYKTVFYIDRANSAIRVVSSGAQVSDDLVPDDATYVVVFGGNRFERDDFQLLTDESFRLFKRTGVGK